MVPHPNHLRLRAGMPVGNREHVAKTIRSGATTLARRRDSAYGDQSSEGTYRWGYVIGLMVATLQGPRRHPLMGIEIDQETGGEECGRRGECLK